MAEEEKPEYFYRLLYLVVDLGTETLRKVFQKHIPDEQNIEGFLKSQEAKIKKLEKYLNDMQYKIITANPLQVSEFDISLFSFLIRNLTSIQPPINNWKNDYPEPSDKSPGAYLLRLKSVRNGVIAHRSRSRMTKSEFEKCWSHTEDVLLELAAYVNKEEKAATKQKIDEAKTKQLVDQSQIEELSEKLVKWCMEEIQQETKRLEDEIKNERHRGDRQQTEIDFLKKNFKEIRGLLQLLGLDLKAEQVSADDGGPSATEIDGMERELKQIGSIVHKFFTTTGVKGLICRGTDQPQEPPIDNPNALTDEDIKKYSKKLGLDWEIFGIFLGYRQNQLDELKSTYPKQHRMLLHEMLKKWHNVVARCDENPKELLAAAFAGVGNNETAADVLGERNLVEGVKNLRPKPETEKLIQDIEFQAPANSGVSLHIHGNVIVQSPQN